MQQLWFAFFKILEEVEISTNLRLSVWLEENQSYLMPCQFKEVWEEKNFYTLKVEVLDPDRFITNKYLEKKFLFGHPGEIIGYGILKEIAESD
jgi:hypothetical protein